MADLSNQSVLGIKVEGTSGTYDAPNNSTDLVVVAELRPNIAGLTSQIQEFTGSIHQPGPTVSGATFEVTGRILLRGPGGSAPPSADTFVPGRVLRAAGFSETVISAAVPTSPEALAAATTTSVTLGSTAAGTADLYKAVGVLLAAVGSGFAGLTMLRSYTAGKLATVARVFGTAPTGNYQVPRQLAYRLDASGTPPTLSVSCWIGGKRYNGKGCTVSSLRIVLPTASRDNQDPPSIEFTLTGDLESDATEACPSIAVPTVSPPPFRAGQLWIANARLAASNVTIDLGAEIAYEPNPNQASGNNAAQLTRTTRTVNMTLSQVPKATFDPFALAAAQSQHGLSAIWGSAAGNTIGLIVTDMRFNYPSPDNSGPLVNTTGEAYIDDANRSIGLVFPY
jgi:hypothetical protein